MMKHNLNLEIIDYNKVSTWCVLCVDSILSLQARKQNHVGITWGFMKAPGFRPSPRGGCPEAIFFEHKNTKTHLSRPKKGTIRYLFLF
jgi:hypothetical protein